MTAHRVHTDSRATSAMPPLPHRPLTMQEWINRPRPRLLDRLLGRAPKP